MLNFKKVQLFPFSYKPENPMSRKVISSTEKSFSFEIDFSVATAPECAAVSIILNKDIPAIVGFKLEQFGTLNNSIIELKKGNKQKCSELLFNFKVDSIYSASLFDDTTEIVFAFFKANNENKKGVITVTNII